MRVKIGGVGGGKIGRTEKIQFKKCHLFLVNGKLLKSLKSKVLSAGECLWCECDCFCFCVLCAVCCVCVWCVCVCGPRTLMLVARFGGKEIV